jgi:beta-glucosidase-like glycosyl hydrolase/CubicO group peptidase (beta-lactamase class C family)
MKNILLISLLISQCLVAQDQIDPVLTDDPEAQRKWVDKQMKSMTLEEKLGQLFMVAGFTKNDLDNTKEISNFIDKYHVGGVIFSKGNPYKQAKITNQFQENSNIPLLIGMDAEWGLAMRLDSTYAFPYNLTLGAIQDDNLVREIGYQIGNHNRRLGVHINFAPVVDINTNPKNPIIGNRSFGENKYNVTDKASAFMKGMQEAGILACGKHFPGHGDTDADSHKTLPTVNFSKDRIKKTELYPYKKLIDKGLNAVMIAHLNIPELTENDELPTTLSQKVIQDQLKEQLGFSGLIISDAMNMKGVTNYDGDQPSIVKAFQAGNDILLIPDNLPKNFKQLKTALKNGVITKRRLDYSVRKILFAKYKVGLADYQPIKTDNLTADLNSPYNEALTYRAFSSAATLIKNDLGTIPFQSVQKKTALIPLGDGKASKFEAQLNVYDNVAVITKEEVIQNINQVEQYDRLIISHHQDTSSPWNNYEISASDKQLIDQLSNKTSVVLVNFTSPYALIKLKSTLSIDAMLNLYENHPIAQKVAASIIYGARQSKGKLPVSISRAFPERSGLKSKNLFRLYNDLPQNAGFSKLKLEKVDSMIKASIENKQMPGVQLLIAKDRKVVYQKNYGYYRYKKQKKVTDSTLYDIASLTKIMATLPALMHLYERNALNFDDTLGDLLSDYKGSNKEDISIKKMLSHYARLKDWIPFYQSTLEDREKYYREKQSDSFSIKLTDEMYLRTDFKDSIKQKVRESKLNDSLEYDYSDLPFYILKQYIEEKLDNSLDQVAHQLFYKPLGNRYMLYHPLERFDKVNIAPSYVDEKWREQEIQGIVQDQGAAMLGGVGGHAGLFANSRNVAKMMQLYLNGGHYGGKRYFNQETIDAFNTCYYCDENVRRGIGFDKPQLEDIGPTCGCISMNSFGHSGYTGAYTWADPEEDLIYVFLTNRTYPNIENDKIVKENTRTEIQRLIYDAIID